MRNSAAEYAAKLILVFDATLLGAWWYFIPQLNRPLDALALLVIGLGVVTALLSKCEWVRGLSVTFIVVAALLFGLEMAQKRFNILRYLDAAATVPATGSPAKSAPNPYAWDHRDAESYLAVRKRAIADGVEPEAFTERFAGDIFAGMDKSKLVIIQRDQGGWTRRIESLKPVVFQDKVLGGELTPGNLIRYRGFYRDLGQTFLDARTTINPFGFRETRGRPGADKTFVFLGCSITYGFFLGDDQTIPHYFSEAGGFANRVLNLAYNGYGPQHALRDLELNHHMGRAGVDPKTVKGVVYTLIDDHARRAMQPDPSDSPRYALDRDGVLRPEPPLDAASHYGRLLMVLEKSRLYQQFRERLLYNFHKRDIPHKWGLTLAILARMDSICRERYGVGLTVVYWDSDPGVMQMLRESGIRFFPVSDALGTDWEIWQIKYQLIDGHPSAYANQKIGRFVYDSLRSGNE